MPQGTIIGPEQTDVAWDTMECVPVKHLLDKPLDMAPQDVSLLRSASHKSLHLNEQQTAIERQVILIFIFLIINII